MNPVWSQTSVEEQIDTVIVQISMPRKKNPYWILIQILTMCYNYLFRYKLFWSSSLWATPFFILNKTLQFRSKLPSP